MKVSRGVLHLLYEEFRGELHCWPELEEYRSRAPEGAKIVEIIKAYEDASMDYGVLDLYVVQQGDRFFGVKLYRAVGKHADYNELFEEEEFELQPLKKELVERWMFDE